MDFLCILQDHEDACDRLVLDFDPDTKQEFVAVHPYIASKLKPHQVNYRHVF
jgi:hypothetical protein